MASTLPTPRISKTSQYAQLSYELPHRIHTAKVYPIKSPNGSTIIIYGHENGVKVIWRGGRPFKPTTATPPAATKANGTSNAIISLDSDDEGESASNFVDKPEFEEEEEELDPAKPFASILQVLDLWTGVAVLHLALLPSAAVKADSAVRGLELLKQKIVFAATFEDNSVRLVTLPLIPPSPASKARAEFRKDFTSAQIGKGKWGEDVILLNGHQKSSRGVSMTLDIPGSPKDDKRATGPHLVVASHAQEVVGRLLLWRIPLKFKNSSVDAFQSVYLSSPARTICFNPSRNENHATLLLVAEATGACRVYDYKLLIKTSDEALDSSSTERGTWSLSLYTGFRNSKNDGQVVQQIGSHAGFGRKSIVDAKWVSGGSAIVVLLDDGEWGLWDIDNTGPGAAQGVLGRQGITGGSRTEYTLSGYIETNTKSKSTNLPQITGSKFAPMTPGTRKTTEPFHGKSLYDKSHGEISVIAVPSTSPTSPTEESLLFWLGDTYAIIPCLAKFWATQSRSNGGTGSLFNGPAGARMAKLDHVDLQGERCSGVEQIPKVSSSGLPVDILILGEHRFAILSTGKSHKENLASRGAIASRLALAEKGASKGELDVLGIEQELAKMDDSTRARRKIFAA